ncbi:MAG: DUF4209 domain-containing protein [Anaerolineaceae bacterium]|jgi:hypothetical protein|nr:DUF4209 domain-containing protein [Anaerolineaceae bacterium]
MRIDELKISINDFKGICFEKTISKSETKTSFSYSALFREECKKYEVNSKAWKAYSMFEAMTNFVLNQDDTGDAFLPAFSDIHSKTVLPQDFTIEQLEIFNQLLPTITDPELKARFADVLWEMRFGEKPYKYAEIAIAAYLLSAEALLQSSEYQIFSIERIKRSITLARRIKYKNHPNMFQSIQTLANNFEIEDIVFIRIIQMLLESGFLPDEQFLEKSKERYEKYVEEKDYVKAERYCDLIADWYKLTRDDDLKRSARINQANILVFRAEQNAASSNYIAAAAFIKEAIESLGNIEDTELKRAELKKKLLKYQSEISENLNSFEFSVDLSDCANQAITSIKGKSKEEAILTLAFIDGIPRKEYIRKQVEEIQTPLLSLISREIIDDNGRTLANNSPSLNVDEGEEEKALEEDMFSYVSNFERGIRVEGLIKPCLYQINLEHHICETDLEFIVNNNPFIPEDRKKLFTRGLLAGFKSDFIVSTHILGLQIENSIRYVLNTEGVITTSLSSEGIQEEIDINRLLDFKELIPIFGEDLVFDLKGLLISRFGNNLRNQIAHALLSSHEFYSQGTTYLWWLTLKICALPYFQKLSNMK